MFWFFTNKEQRLKQIEARISALEESINEVERFPRRWLIELAELRTERNYLLTQTKDVK